MYDDNNLFGPELKNLERKIFKIRVGNLTDEQILIHMKRLMHPETVESIIPESPGPSLQD